MKTKIEQADKNDLITELKNCSKTFNEFVYWMKGEHGIDFISDKFCFGSSCDIEEGQLELSEVEVIDYLTKFVGELVKRFRSKVETENKQVRD